MPNTLTALYILAQEKRRSVALSCEERYFAFWEDGHPYNIFGTFFRLTDVHAGCRVWIHAHPGCGQGICSLERFSPEVEEG